MSQPFVGQIALFPFDFAPQNWLRCTGQLLPISQYPQLSSLLGTMYGGDGKSTFALPDLRGRVATNVFRTNQGEYGGVEQVALSSRTNAKHNHSLNATTNQAKTATASGNVLAYAYLASSRTSSNSGMIYTTSNLSPNASLGAATIGSAGRSKPHNNIQPYLALSYCIALTGVYPDRP